MENIPQTALWVIIMLVVLALAFDFMNGFHDAANSIATVVSTGVLRPGQAVLFAAFFNFVAIFVFHLSVATTVGKGIVQPGVVDTHVVFGALIGAITWNLITWYYGIPSSSSHALIGGIVGAVIGKAGTDALLSAGILKTLVFIFASPMLGFLLGSLMMLLVAWLFRRTTPSRVDGWWARPGADGTGVRDIAALRHGDDHRLHDRGAARQQHRRRRDDSVGRRAAAIDRVHADNPNPCP